MLKCDPAFRQTECGPAIRMEFAHPQKHRPQILEFEWIVPFVLFMNQAKIKLSLWGYFKRLNF
jgi:hypothetical protein